MVNIKEYDEMLLEDELLNRLRFVCNPYDPQRRVLEKEIILEPEEDTLLYDLSQNLSYIKRVIEIDSQDNEELLRYGQHYRIVYKGDEAGSVEFVSMDLDKTYKIIYGVVDKSNNKANFVYTDFPNRNMDESVYPRIGFELSVSTNTEGFGAGEIAYGHDILIQIQVVDSNILRIEEFVKLLSRHLKNYSTSFHNFHYIQPNNMQNYNNYSDNTQKNKVRMIQFTIPRRREIVELKQFTL